MHKNYKVVLVSSILCAFYGTMIPAQAQRAPDAGQDASYLITNRQMKSDLTPQNSIHQQIRAQSAKQECDSTCAASAGLNPSQSRTLRCPQSFETMENGDRVQTAGGEILQISNLRADGTYSAWENASGECWNNS